MGVALEGVFCRVSSEQRRGRVVNGGVEPEDFAFAYQSGCLDDALGGEKVEAADLIVVTENAPIGLGGCSRLHRQLRELGDLVKVYFGHSFTLLCLFLCAGAMRFRGLVPRTFPCHPLDSFLPRLLPSSEVRNES